MSIHEMLALHPNSGAGFNESLATAARHAMFCSAMCTACADACTAEEMDMQQCIRSCLDCADICDATARLALRRTGQNIAVLRLMLHSCAKICESCAGECARHDYGHCALCADMCRECARDCRAATQAVQ